MTAAAAQLARAGVTLRLVPAPPPVMQPPTPPKLTLAPALAAEIEAQPIGTWIEVSGAAITASGLVSACRRRGFRVAVRTRGGCYLVLRGRPMSVDDEGVDVLSLPMPEVRTGSGLEPYCCSPRQRTAIEGGEAELVRQGQRFYVRHKK